MAGQSSLQDGNQQPTLVVSQGTVGTAAIDGTALTMRLNGNPATGALYVNDNGTVTTTLLPLSGVVLAGTLGIGTTATAIPATALSSRKSMIIYNTGTTTVYLGGTGVTANTGLPVGTTDYSPSFDLGTTIIYGIAGTAGGTVRVLEVS